jgi:hypothetical protein
VTQQTAQPETSQPAGRCIALIRPHSWTRWHVNERKVLGAGTVSIQTRQCLRCGHTQMETL